MFHQNPASSRRSGVLALLLAGLDHSGKRDAHERSDEQQERQDHHIPGIGWKVIPIPIGDSWQEIDRPGVREPSEQPAAVNNKRIPGAGQRGIKPQLTHKRAEKNPPSRRPDHHEKQQALSDAARRAERLHEQTDDLRVGVPRERQVGKLPSYIVLQTAQDRNKQDCQQEDEGDRA